MYNHITYLLYPKYTYYPEAIFMTPFTGRVYFKDWTFIARQQHSPPSCMRESAGYKVQKQQGRHDRGDLFT